MECEIDRWISAADAVVVLVCHGEERSEVKDEELWVMTERIRSRIQAAKMSFLRRVAGRSLRDRVRSSVTREELGVEPLLLHI